MAAAAPCGSSAPPHPAAARHYLTCCVRLSPEKEPHRYDCAPVLIDIVGIYLPVSEKLG